MLEAYAAYSQAADLHASDTLWSSGRGVHIIEGAGVNHGWAEYRDEHLKPELERFENFEYRFSSIEPQIRGNVAWAAFRYTVVADIDERHIDIEGRGTAVLEKVGGRWVISHLHTSGRPRRVEGSS